MSVSGIGGGTLPVDVDADEPDVEKPVGQFVSGLASQGSALRSTAEQAFGSDKPSEKAKNIEIS